MRGLISRARSLWRGVRRRADVEADMAEEFRHHIELRTEDLVRRGYAPAEAARQARIEFGRVENHKEDARAARGLAAVDQLRVSWLDVKLGLRMFRKHPGLSTVSVIGMSVAIAVAAGYFGVIGAFLSPTLPLHEGERVVAIQNALVTDAGATRQTLRDYVAWRDGLKTVREVAAFSRSTRNLVVPGRSVELVDIARMTASAFGVARIAPAMGRPILPDDEREGAPPVVVISHDEWQRVFGGDPAILGRAVRLGGEVHTVVGVMPEGYHFPVNHDYWVPQPVRLTDVERGTGPNLVVFGRLAPGATIDAANAELAVVGARMARTFKETHEHLRPRVMPYTYAVVGIQGPAMETAMRALQLAIGLLLVVVAANVAILVYARVASRTGEIAVRTALGASRKRVITQLFVEAFVLSGASAVIGLTITATAYRVLWAYHERNSDFMWPFWIRLGLTPSLVAYVAGLAVLAGVIVGVVPALKATGRRVQEGLKQLSTRGSEQQLGRTWTALIVVQVAIAVAILPSAIFVASNAIRGGAVAPRYPADEIARATLGLELEDPSAAGPVDTAAAARAYEARYRARGGALLRRLEADPGVAAVTVSLRTPGSEGMDRIEVEGSTPTAAGAPVTQARTNEVDAGFFPVYGVQPVAGRTFVDADERVGSNAIVVDEMFVKRFLNDGRVLGRRVRTVSERPGGTRGELDKGPWLEVIGVVPHFTQENTFESADPVMYRPMSIGTTETTGLQLAVRVRGGGPASRFVTPLREIAASVDPTLRLVRLRTAAEAELEDRQAMLFMAIAVSAITASVLLLSATGIYAMMSFTITKRRREIGIRAALGADRRRVLTGVLARASAQLGTGVAIGLVLAALVDDAAGFGSVKQWGIVLLPGVAALMLAIGLLAALGPARRGLAVQPTEALREE